MLKRIAKGNLLFLKPTRSFPLSTLNEKISIEKLAEMKGTIELLQSQKLKEIQKKYISDSNNLRITYEYIRELNRNEKYEEANRVYRDYEKSFSWGSSFFRDGRYGDPVKKKIEKQFEYTFEKMKAFESTTQNANKLSIFRYFMLFTLMGLIYMIMTGQISFEFTKSKSSNDSDDGNLRGSLTRDLLFGNKKTVMEEKNIETRFKDVIGIDEFKDELMELVDYLKYPKKYTDAGAKLPKGILLIGPPGTGKTLLARALAGEAECSFFYKSGSEFDEMFVGVGAKRVRELFKTAREKAPSIIFIDEIDSVAGTRKANDQGHARDTINQILAEMDGFKQSDNVIVIGASNMEKAIDPAIKRPGRFDKTIHLPYPDVKGREDLFKYYLKKIKYDVKTVNARALAQRTPGYTGADIQNMINMAILNAIKENRKFANGEDLEFAHDRVSMGTGRTKMVISDKEKLMTAYHEGGHTLTAMLTDGSDPIHKVTILPRGPALGFTAMTPSEDRIHNQTKKSLLAKIDVAMGGRAAEELLYGNDEITTGCSSDLSNATSIAYSYVKHLGMSEISLAALDSSHPGSSKYNYAIDMEVQKLLKESYDRVYRLLKENQPMLSTLAQELVTKETLSKDDIEKLLEIKSK